MSRRGLLVAFGALAMLAGCKTPPTASQVASDISDVAKGLKNALPSFISAVGGNVDRITMVSDAVGDVQVAAAAFATADTQQARQSVVQRVEADVNGVLGALSNVPLPPQAEVILKAISILLPVIETAVGMIVPGATPSVSDIAHARMVLRNS